MANFKKIKNWLDGQDINYEIIDLERQTYTVSDVTKSGIDEKKIVKTLIVRTNKGFVAIAIKGKDRADFKKVRKLFGNKSELAKPEEVKEVVDVPVGAVCPILVGIPLYFDKKLVSLKRINMGSGDLRHGLEMEFEDFLKAVEEYKVEDLVI